MAILSYVRIYVTEKSVKIIIPAGKKLQTKDNYFYTIQICRYRVNCAKTKFEGWFVSSFGTNI